MPIYEYRCPNGHEFEVFQSMAEDPVARCRECGAPVERVFHPVAVHFKGSGFYTTDYARSKAAAGASKDGGAEGGEAKKPDSKGEGEKKESGKKESGGEKAKAASGDD